MDTVQRAKKDSSVVRFSKECTLPHSILRIDGEKMMRVANEDEWQLLNESEWLPPRPTLTTKTPVRIAEVSPTPFPATAAQRYHKTARLPTPLKIACYDQSRYEGGVRAIVHVINATRENDGSAEFVYHVTNLAPYSRIDGGRESCESG